MVPAVTTGPLWGCPCLRDSPGTVSLPMFLLPGLAPGKGLGQAHTPLIGSPFRAYVSWSGVTVCFGDVVPKNTAPRVIRSLRSERTHHDMKKEPTSVCLSVCPSSRLSKSGCGRWNFRKEAQTRPSPAPFHHLHREGNPKAFPGQPRYRISPAYPRSDLESLPGWTCPKHLPREASGWHPGGTDLTLGNQF